MSKIAFASHLVWPFSFDGRQVAVREVQDLRWNDRVNAADSEWQVRAVDL